MLRHGSLNDERKGTQTSRRLAHPFLGFADSAPGKKILDVLLRLRAAITEALAEHGDHASVVSIDVSEVRRLRYCT